MKYKLDYYTKEQLAQMAAEWLSWQVQEAEAIGPEVAVTINHDLTLHLSQEEIKFRASLYLQELNEGVIESTFNFLNN